MILHKNGLTLRAIDVQDAPVLLDMINDPEIEGSVGGWSFPVSSVAQLKWIEDMGRDKTAMRCAVDPGDGIVGMVSVTSLDMKNRTGELNVKLIRAARGKGIAAAALQLLIEYCFTELDLYCLTAYVLEDNEASNRLFLRLGFQREGVLRGRIFKRGCHKALVAYSMLRDEYDARDRQ